MEDVYLHMSVVPHETAEADERTVPPRLTPQFSLKFLRQATDPAMLLTPDGRTSFVNDAACRLLGLDGVKDATGRQIWELWSDPDAVPVMRHATEVAADGDAVRFPAVSGTEADLQSWTFIFSPVINAQGKVESIFATVQPA